MLAQPVSYHKYLHLCFTNHYSPSHLVGRCPFPYVVSQENIPVFFHEAYKALTEIQHKLSVCCFVLRAPTVINET